MTLLDAFGDPIRPIGTDPGVKHTLAEAIETAKLESNRTRTQTLLDDLAEACLKDDETELCAALMYVRGAHAAGVIGIALAVLAAELDEMTDRFEAMADEAAEPEYDDDSGIAAPCPGCGRTREDGTEFHRSPQYCDDCVEDYMSPGADD